jgi:proline racemase
VPIDHPDEPDLAFLYGIILTDGQISPSRNVCIFAGRQIDRSPTGSGVSARMALQIARRQAKLGEERRFESCTGAVFTGKALREGPSVGPRKSVIVEVGGIAHVTGEAKFRFDDDDPLKDGFTLSS